MTGLPGIALIGCGRIGSVHLRSLLGMPDRCHVAVVADPVETSIDRVRHQFPSLTTTTDVGEVFDHPGVNAVVIASSTASHAGHIIAAARAGKDAFTEKPIALDLDSTDAALEAVAAAGTRLQVGFQRRFDPAYAEAARAIRAGELGSLMMIRDAMRDPEPPAAAYLQSSGGLFRDMTVHNFDCVRWLMGEHPIEVTAIGPCLISEDVRAIGDIDTAIVTLRFPSGSMASIENSRQSSFGYDVRTEVFGASGALLIDDSRKTALRRLDRTGVHEDHRTFFIDRFATAYRREIEAFVDSIATDSPVQVTGADGRSALELAGLAEQSLVSRNPIPIEPAVVPFQEVSQNRWMPRHS